MQRAGHELSGGGLRVLLERLAVLGDPETDLCDALFHAVAAATACTQAAGAGAVLADAAGGLHVVASANERTSEVEEAELGIVQGPCLEAYESGAVVDVPDFAARADDWPDVFRVAEERGFGGVYAVPLRLRGRTVGTICVFSPRGVVFSDVEAAMLQLTAEAAVVAIAQRMVLEGVPLDALIQLALSQRDTIEQAKGALSDRRKVPIDQAFRILLTEARDAGLTLAHMAERVTAGGVSL